MILFKTTDTLNRNIYLPDFSWNHIQEEHQEFTSFASISTTIEAPNVIIPDVRKNNYDIYYKLGALSTYPWLYVGVVVRFYKVNLGKIVTAHLTDEMREAGPGGFKYVQFKR